MKQVRDLKPASQLKVQQFAKSWLGKIPSDFLDESLDAEIGTMVSAHLTSHFIHYAIECDDADLMEDLYENGADINKVDYVLGRLTPLQYAADLGRANLVDKLLEWKADAREIKFRYSADCCKQPRTFFWSIKERAMGRNVDYDEVYFSLGVQ